MLRFVIEPRSNGISYVSVFDGQAEAGQFAGARANVATIAGSLALAGVLVEEVGLTALVRKFAPLMLPLIGEPAGEPNPHYRRPFASQPIEPPTKPDQAVRALEWFITACQARGANLAGWTFDYWEESVRFPAPPEQGGRVWIATKLYAIAPDGTDFFACSPDEINTPAKAHTPAVSFLQAAGIEADLVGVFS